MKSKWFQAVFVSVGLVLASFGASAADKAAPTHSERWNIEVKGNAKSDGELALRVTPNQGEPQDLTVKVANGRTEKQIATDIRDVLTQKLPSERYDISASGDEVEVKAKKNQPAFVVEFVSSTVAEAQISIKAR
jgi:hypothetical protein